MLVAKHPSAVQAMKYELELIQKAQAECVDDNDIIRSECRYKYAILCRAAGKFKFAIDWMENMYRGDDK